MKIKNLSLTIMLFAGFPLAWGFESDRAYIKDPTCPFLVNEGDSDTAQFVAQVQSALKKLPCQREADQVQKLSDRLSHNLSTVSSKTVQVPSLDGSAAASGLSGYLGIPLDCRNYRPLLGSARDNALKHAEFMLEPAPGFEHCWEAPPDQLVGCIHWSYGEKLLDLERRCGLLGAAGAQQALSEDARAAITQNILDLQASITALITAEGCNPEQATHEVKRKVVETAIHVGTLLALAEPVSGAATIGIALAGQTLSALTDKYFDEKQKQILLSEDILEGDAEFRAFACLFLDGSKKDSGCEPALQRDSDNKTLPGFRRDPNIRSRPSDNFQNYLFGNSSQDGSMRRFSTVAAEIQKTANASEAKELELLGHLDSALSAPMSSIPQRGGNFTVRDELKRIAQYFAGNTTKFSGETNVEFQTRRREEEAASTALQSFLAADEALATGSFANDRQRMEALHLLFKRVQDVNQVISGGHSLLSLEVRPLNIDAILDRYWKSRFATEPHSNGFKALRQEELVLAQKGDIRHQELLRAYRISQPPVANAGPDFSRDRFQIAHDKLLERMKPHFARRLEYYENKLQETIRPNGVLGQIKKTGNRLFGRKADDNNPVIDSINDAAGRKAPKLSDLPENRRGDYFDTHLLPLLKLCSLGGSAFLKLPGGRLEDSGYGLRGKYEESCKRFDCAGGIQRFEFDNKGAWDNYDCFLINGYYQRVAKLREAFIRAKNPSLTQICDNDLGRETLPAGTTHRIPAPSGSAARPNAPVKRR